ncbi:unnamed protein product [Adineta steineri]|uniref:Carboxymethylenebutenolidase homolog n=1 Tax=Adineta steineri TaxID=433720 RepID=A0A819I8K8_9BILA|nr:unnamed protein product [Adineta steineri]
MIVLRHCTGAYDKIFSFFTATAQNNTYPLGTVHSVGSSDLNVYDVVGDNGTTINNNVAMIVLYDIRGFNVSNTRLFCERLAYEYKIRVLMPDFFRDQPTANATWPRVEQDLLNVNTYLQSEGYTKIGLIGFCWGGLRVMKACGNGNNVSWTNTPFFTGISIHGSGLNVPDANVLQVPMLFIRAGNDPSLDNITAVLNQTSFGDKCEYKVYQNMTHGFVSAGANYLNPANVAAIDDVHQTLRAYLNKIVASTYPLGTVHSVGSGDLNVYDVVGDSETKTKNNVAMIVLYDIRGFNVTNTRLFCERLAYEYKIRVLMPDFFRDQPTANATWSRVEQDLLTVNTYLHSEGYTKIGLIGFCWGGLRAMKACGNGNNVSWTNTPFFTGISIHGSQLNVPDANVLQVPMLFIRAGNDPSFDSITAVLDQKLFGSRCEYKGYQNMTHGFVSAGANYSNPANVAAIDDVHQTLRTYLSKTVASTYPFGTVHSISGSDLKVYDVVGDHEMKTKNNVAMIVLYDIRDSCVDARLLQRIPDQPTANATWPRVEQDLLTVHTYLQSQKYTKIGLIGFCWGGLRALKACGNGNNVSWTNTPFFTGISIHGSGLNVADADVLQVPMLFIRAGNDPSFDNITAVLNQKPFGNKCEYEVYQNMTHGFVSAGANYLNPENVAAIDDVHGKLRAYLSKIVGNGSENIKASFITIVFFAFFVKKFSAFF